MSAQPKDKNFFERVKTARTDTVVGICVIPVKRDDALSLYVAAPELHRSVPAHYHQAVSGIDQIVHGEGKLHTGVPSPDDEGAWSRPVEVTSGDCFTVPEGQVHQRENTVSPDLIAIIVCHHAHIGHDRFIVPGAVTHQPEWGFLCSAIGLKK
jgi:mannose-6-phosphate isomerase-like protein (cupin superfamily)